MNKRYAEDATGNVVGQFVCGLAEDKAVVCEVDAVWEGVIGCCVHEIVGHVDEVGPRSVDLLSGLDRLLDGEVGWVGAMTEGIEDERIC